MSTSLIVSVIALPLSTRKVSASRYQIWVNDQCIYSCGMNNYPNKINQVIYTFDAKETKTNLIKIRITVKNALNTRLINGMLDVRTVILRQQHGKPYGKETIMATEQLLQGKFPNQ